MAGKSRNEIGNAVLQIAPAFDDFRKKLDAGLKQYQNEKLSVTVVPDFDRFKAQFQAFKEQMERQTIRIGVGLDVRQARAEGRAFRERESAQRINNRVEANTAPAAADIARLRAAAEANAINIDVDVDGINEVLQATATEAALRERIAQARIDERRAADAESEEGVKEARAARAAAEEQLSFRRTLEDSVRATAEQQRRSDFDHTASAEEHLSLARRESAILEDRERARQRGDDRGVARANEELRARREMARIESARSDENRVGRQGEDENFRVVQPFRGTTLFNLSNITQAATGVAAIAGALGGALASAAAIGTALAAVGAAGIIGGSGVFSAFSALRAANKSAAGKADDSADAMRRQREEMQRVADAQESVADGARDLARDQQKVSDAVRDATRDLRDMNMELQDSKLSQEGAAIAVARARERLAETLADRAKGKASALDVQEAQLGVKQAQQGLRTAQVKYSDKRIDTAEANRKGVSGSDQVVAAKQTVADDVRKLAKAQRELADATADVGKAAQKASAPENQFAAAMEKLTPAGRTFVTQMRNLGPEWKKLQQATETSLFTGLGTTITRAAQAQLPEMTRGLSRMAGVLNGVLSSSIERVSATFTEFSNNGTFTAFLDAVESSFRNFAPVIDALVRALTQMTIVMGPQIGTFFGQLADYIVATTPFFSELGRLFLESFGAMLPILARLLDALMPLFQVALPALVSLFDTLTQIFEQNSNALGGLGSGMEEAFTSFLRALMPLIPPFLSMLTSVLNFVGTLENAGLLTGFLAFTIVARTGLGVFIGFGNTVGRTQAAMQAFRRVIIQTRIAMAAYTGSTAVAAAQSNLMGARIGRGMRAAVDGVSGAVSGMGRGIRTGMENTATFVSTRARRMGDAISRSMATAGRNAGTAATAIGSKLNTAMGVAVNAGIAAGGKLSAAWGAISRGVGAATKAMRAFMVAQILAMSVNPIYLIVVAITAIIAILVVCIVKFKGFRDFLVDCAKAIGKGFSALWDGLVSGGKSVWEFMKKVGSGIKDAFKGVVDIMKSPIHLAGALLKLLANLPLVRSTGVGKAMKNTGDRLMKLRDGGVVDAGQRQGVIYGPGTDTSDSILGYDNSGPTVYVSRDEGIVNARGLKKHRRLFDAINRDDASLPHLNTGGAVDGSPGSKPLNLDEFNTLWHNWFAKWAGGNDATTRDFYLTDHPAVNRMYRSGQRPPSEERMQFNTAWDLFFNSQDIPNDEPYSKRQFRGSETPDQAEQRVNKARNEWLERNQDAKSLYETGQYPPSPDQVVKDKGGQDAATKKFNDAWSAWFAKNTLDGNTNDRNRQAYLDSNPNIKNLYRNGKLPPGQDQSFELRPGAYGRIQKDDDLGGLGASDPGLSADEQSLAKDLGIPSYDMGTNTYEGMDPNASIGAGAEGQVTPDEVARMGGGTVNLSILKSIRSKFPGAVLTSAKTDHDVDGGFHPKGEAIDVGPDRGVLDYLWGIRDQLVQIIFDDPQKVWYNVEGQRAEGSAARAIYGEGTMAQHADHIHVAATQPVVTPGVNLGGAGNPSSDYSMDTDLGAEGSYGYEDADGDGYPDSAAGGLGSDGGTDADSMYDQLSLQGIGRKGSDILIGGILDFFGLGDSILSETNPWNEAIRNTGKGLYDATKDGIKSYDTLYGDFLEAQFKDEDSSGRKEKKKPNTGNVGTGNPDDPRTRNLLRQDAPDTSVDYSKSDREELMRVQQMRRQGMPATAGGSVKDRVKAAWAPRGWNVGPEWEAGEQLVQGESSWNPTARNPSSGAFGLFQFLGSTKDQYLPDENPDPYVQGLAGAKYIADRPDYGTPSKAYQMWLSRSPHWYADGGPVSGPGGPRDDQIAAFLSNGEFVVNAASAAAAPELLKQINSSPEAARMASRFLTTQERARAAGASSAPGAMAGRAPMSGAKPQAPGRTAPVIQTGDINTRDERELKHELETTAYRAAFPFLVK